MDSLRELLEKFTGTRVKPNPLDAELRRLSAIGDEARRNRQYDIALQTYQEGLTTARDGGYIQGQEVFLGQIGALYTEQRLFDQAAQALSEALRLAEQSGEAIRKARALLNFGAYNLVRGDLPTAQRYLEQSLEAGRPTGDPVTVSLALGNLGDVYLRQDNPTYALRLLKEANTFTQSTSNLQHASYIIGRLAQAHLGVGDTDRGRRLLAQAIQLAQQFNQPEHELRWTILLADQLVSDGQLPDALKMYQRADTLFGQVGRWPDDLPNFRQRSLLNQAIAYQRLGESQKALDYTNQALEEVRKAGDVAAEAMALSTLSTIQRAMGKREEAIASLKAAIALYSDKTPNEAERTQLTLALGNLYQEYGEPDKAMEYYEQAVADASLDDPAGRARALQRVGSALKEQGNLSAALEKLTEALALFEKVNDHTQIARLLCDTGSIRRTLSGINAALPDYERATVVLNNVTDIATRGFVLSNVAILYTDLGEVETAQSFYQESIQLARQTGQRWAESLRLGNFGWFYTVTGQVQDGIGLLEEAIGISRQLNDPLLVAVQTNNLAQAYHELKDYKTAEVLIGQSLAVANGNMNDRRWKAIFQSNLGRTLAAQGHIDEALRLFEESLATSRSLNDQETTARTLTRMADIYLNQGRLDAADEAAREAELMARKWGFRKGQADALVVRSGAARAHNDIAAADNYLREAQKLYSILHDPLAGELARTLEAKPG